MKTCPNCGSMNADDARFCEGCGTALEEKEAVPQVEAEVVSGGASDSKDVYNGGNTVDNGVSGPGSSQDNGNGQGYSGQSYAQPNYGDQGYTQQNYNMQGYNGHNYNGQGYNGQNYTGQSYNGQNYNGQSYGGQNYSQPPQKDLTTVCTLSLVFGIVSFFCDPLYLFTTAAFILGIIGLVNNGSKKNFALAGLICSVLGCGVQIFLDIITLGIGVFF